MLGPFATERRFTLPFTRCRYCHTPPLSHAACASMSTTTTTRDRGDRYGPIEWAQRITSKVAVAWRELKIMIPGTKPIYTLSSALCCCNQAVNDLKWNPWRSMFCVSVCRTLATPLELLPRRVTGACVWNCAKYEINRRRLRLTWRVVLPSTTWLRDHRFTAAQVLKGYTYGKFCWPRR